MNNYRKKYKGHGGSYSYYNDNDYLHRLDGPANEFMNEYYINGYLISEKGFKRHPAVLQYKKQQLIKKLLKG